MKKIILLAVFFIYNVMNAQKINWESSTIDHNPNSKNELSLYLKKQVSKRTLRKIKFQPKENNIILSFNINNENKPYRISINNFGGKELTEAIKEAFEIYPLEKLNLEDLDKRNKYYLQIISKKGSKNIFNCSSKVIVETPPICNSCNNLEFYEDIKTCLNIEVKKYFYKNSDFSILNNLDEDEINLFIQFAVSKEGKLIDKKTKVPSVFRNEVIRVLETFSNIEKTGTFNGVENQQNHSFTILFKKGEKPVYEESTSFEEFTKPNPENELSQFFSKNLTEEFIDKANLNRVNKNLVLYFELDDNNTPFNINTNARSQLLEDKIISIFKEYPINQLNFSNKKPFSNYILQILSFTENRIIVNANSNVGFQSIPIFPGCEISKTVADAKNCFSRGVQMHFAKKFDTELPNRLGLSAGRKRVLIRFKIDKEGNIVDVKSKAPHPKIENEVISVIKKLPKMKPGSQNGTNINIKFSIPFTLIIK